MRITIEKATPADAAALLAFLKQVGGETENLTFGGEGLPFTVEAEAQYLASMENSRDDVMLLAKINGEIVGNASLSRMPRRMRHRGDFSTAAHLIEVSQSSLRIRMPHFSSFTIICRSFGILLTLFISPT